MTAVLPDTRSPANGRHRAPDDATTGSIGAVPTDMRSRSAHAGPRTDGPAPLQRAARTAGLSLAALGALAAAGGAAAHGLGAPDEPATGEVALAPQLASSDLALGHGSAAPAVNDVRASAVMPVVSSALAAPTVKHDSPATRAAASAASAASHARQAASTASASSHSQPEAPSTASSVGAQALAAAKSKIGVPYEWGATGPTAFDCSGLMQWAFEQAGDDELPRTSKAQSQVGQEVSRDNLQPGDLIFIYSPVSHVAMYAGNGQVIEAPTEGEDVKMSKLSKYDDEISGMRRL